jgi:nicotinate dehydrogenase subunit A
VLEIEVNGKRHTVAAEPATPLLYVLRNELNLTGPKFGCGLGQCGACTVHLNGEAVRSCLTPVAAVVGSTVTTVEGLGDGELHPLQQAFIEEQAAQCGYCTSGMIMTGAALLRAMPNANDRELRSVMSGNLCRCGTHLRILRALKRVLETQRVG